MNNYIEKVVQEAERISQKDGIKDLLAIEIISLNELQKWVVKKKYYEELKKGKKTCREIKIILSNEYAISYSKIEKLIYRK